MYPSIVRDLFLELLTECDGHAALSSCVGAFPNEKTDFTVWICKQFPQPCDAVLQCLARIGHLRHIPICIPTWSRECGLTVWRLKADDDVHRFQVLGTESEAFRVTGKWQFGHNLLHVMCIPLALGILW